MQDITGWHGGKIRAWVNGVEFEHAAQQQAHKLASMPFVHEHIAIMPDVHMGVGSSVGTVIPTKGAIIPAAVGVDIGCGMQAWRTSLTASDLPDSMEPIRLAIEAAVPVGGPGVSGSWQEQGRQGVPNFIVSAWVEKGLETRFKRLCERYPALQSTFNVVQLGTLGGGNHFIEVCLDEEQRVWIMLHSGSRGVGNTIGRIFIEKAKEMLIKRGVSVLDKDLAWLEEGEPEFRDYIEAMLWAQDFAKINRDMMMSLVLTAIRPLLPPFRMEKEAVNIHHNFAEKEHHFGEDVWVTRKGATRARSGELGIIPGSMGAKSYIVRGKGNADSFCSCSHGAGRRMSRSKAKERYTVEDAVAATEGVACRKDVGIIDEIPMAYKDIDAVMEAQKDLVDIVHVLKQIVCVKG
ncbi:tRNA-splicing ligase [Brevundimonas phage vB_BpoS-Kikimora]|uniref:3'-phosphate/5'-hydroxy nucleic acid ligase n=1 Tax=Brevundimonas phage vB_BpoS-Kikimora TaxID=2948601 RepID=A0A9E7MSQ3_9CAUD|nr:tRNA-splicing ligase [Brevundimonas phage vB_BpoS-Kikimora]